MTVGNHALINGRIFTADDNRRWATAVGIQNGVITYVGDDANAAREAAGPDAEVTDLAGRTATPGLIDVHCHPLYYGGSLANIDLQTGINNVQDILDRVKDAADSTPKGEWLRGWGYYTVTIAEGRPPTRWELDSVAPDHPIELRQRSGHETATNSLGLKLAGLDRDTPDPVGGLLERDEHGELTGVLIENAAHPLNQAAEPDRYSGAGRGRPAPGDRLVPVVRDYLGRRGERDRPRHVQALSEGAARHIRAEGALQPDDGPWLRAGVCRSAWAGDRLRRPLAASRAR